MSEKCDLKCIEKLEAKLKGRHPDAELELSMFIVPDTGETGRDIPPLRFSYTPEPVNGKKVKKRVRTYVRLPFCPICGRRRE